MHDTQPQVEERLFSDAELRIFRERYEAHQEAMARVNALIDILKELHGVDASDGWQLTERGFVRPVQSAQEARVAPQPQEDVTTEFEVMLAEHAGNNGVVAEIPL